MTQNCKYKGQLVAWAWKKWVNDSNDDATVGCVNKISAIFTGTCPQVYSFL